MRTLRLLLSLLFPLALAACPSTDEPPADDDDSARDDGRVQVVGTGFFDTIQEAVDAAPEGGTILLGGGCYDEAFTITKPLSLTGDSPATTVITGGGQGSAITVTGVNTGAVTLNSFLVRVPHDEPATLRTLRVVDSTDVLIHDTELSFETALTPDADTDFCERVYLPDQTTGACDQGLLGIDLSQSTVIVSDTTVSCTGLNAETGGTGILAQTNTDLTITGSTIQAAGSFGIRTVDSTLTVDDLTVTAINRDPSAQDFEANGSAIFVESGSTEVVVDGLDVSSGVFVGLWVESPSLTVTDSTFTGFNYGIYMPGDGASAAGRRLRVTESDFFDLRNEAILASASTTVFGSDFSIKALTSPFTAGTVTQAGVQVSGTGTVNEISNNTFDGLATWGIRVLGSNADGNATSLLAEANTITDIKAGNGIQSVLVDEVILRGNHIDGVDHAYNAETGTIGNGFGVACFSVDDCDLEGNVVSRSEFGNFVIVGSSFSTVDDTATDGLGRGFHIETSQGTFENPTVVDQFGYGILAVDSTIQGEGGVVADTMRGPSIQDIDGNQDPLPGELLNIQGGVSLWIASQGAPTFLSWEDGTFADSANSAVTAQDAQVQLVGNDFLGAGFVDESGYFPSSAVYLSGNDPQALSGPLFANNVVDGGEGSWGMYLSGARGAHVTGNTICAGSSTGLYIRESGGSVIENNRIGNTDDPEVAACDDLIWQRGVYVSQTDPEFSDEGVTLRDLRIQAPEMEYGIYFNGLAAHTVEDVTITDPIDVGLYATMTLPNGLTSDADGDGWRPYQGDCDDTNPNVGYAGAVETPGDGLDNDCDGIADDGIGDDDNDGDGFSPATGDCNDLNPNIHPDMTEVVNNFQDDNCDGWADFDGVYDWLEVDLSGTTISGGEDGIWAQGATIRLLDPTEVDGATNSVGDVWDIGAYVGSWQWSGTPMYRAGSLVVGADTVFGPTGSHCVSVVATDASATLEGTTLAGCGGNGVNLSSAGTATLTDVTIVTPGDAGVLAIGGVLTATNLTVSGNGDAALAVTGYQADATVVGLDVLGGMAGVTQSTGALLLTDLESDGTALSAVQISGGVATLSGLDIEGAGGDGVAVTGGVVTLESSVIGAVDVDGVSVSGGGDLTVTAVDVTGANASGIRVGGGSLDWTDGTVAASDEDNVAVTFGTAVFDNLHLSGGEGAGYAVTGGTVTVNGGSVTGAALAGVFANAGSLTLDGLEVTDCDEDGVVVEGSATVSLLDGVLGTNVGWGLTCDGGDAFPTSSTASLIACEADFNGNGDGPFQLTNGCDAVWSCTDLTP